MRRAYGSVAAEDGTIGSGGCMGIGRGGAGEGKSGLGDSSRPVPPGAAGDEPALHQPTPAQDVWNYPRVFTLPGSVRSAFLAEAGDQRVYPLPQVGAVGEVLAPTRVRLIFRDRNRHPRGGAGKGRSPDAGISRSKGKCGAGPPSAAPGERLPGPFPGALDLLHGLLPAGDDRTPRPGPLAGPGHTGRILLPRTLPYDTRNTRYGGDLSAGGA